MEIIIKRYGYFINQVPNDKLGQWISENVPDVDGGKISAQLRRDKMLAILEKKGYEFSIARVYPELTKRGENYTFKCPKCGGEAYISPKHGVHKCFKCGDAGSILDYAEHIAQWKRDHIQTI